MYTSLPESAKEAIRELLSLRYFTPLLSEQLFFIFGCQRSGTTLLLAILNAHSQIVGTDETEFPSPYPFPSASLRHVRVEATSAVFSRDAGSTEHCCAPGYRQSRSVLDVQK